MGVGDGNGAQRQIAIDLSRAFTPLKTLIGAAAMAVVVTLWINSQIDKSAEKFSTDLETSLKEVSGKIEKVGSDMIDVKYRVGGIEQILREQWKRSEMQAFAQLLEAWNQDPSRPLRVPPVPVGQ